MENPQTIEQVQQHIQELTGEILLRQMEIQRYEQIGHRIIELMVEEQTYGTQR